MIKGAEFLFGILHNSRTVRLASKMRSNMMQEKYTLFVYKNVNFLPERVVATLFSVLSSFQFLVTRLKDHVLYSYLLKLKILR